MRGFYAIRFDQAPEDASEAGMLLLDRTTLEDLVSVYDDLHRDSGLSWRMLTGEEQERMIATARSLFRGARQQQRSILVETIRSVERRHN